jgi:hypothetical protein
VLNVGKKKKRCVCLQRTSSLCKPAKYYHEFLPFMGYNPSVGTMLEIFEGVGEFQLTATPALTPILMVNKMWHSKEVIVIVNIQKKFKYVYDML